MSAPPARASPVSGAAALALCVLAGAAGAVVQGQFHAADLLHYHLYSGYAVLAGRLGRDLAPAGFASFFNPLVDVLQYLGVRYLPALALTALLGAIQGLNFFLVWAIARSVLPGPGPWLAGLAAVLAATGQNAVGLLGTLFGDNLVSLPALFGLFLLVSSPSPGPRRLALAGATGGAAVGLKLTMAPPHVALALVAALVARRARRLDLLVAFALGSLAGFALTDAWWAWSLWSRFENPLFPFFNNLFQSPYSHPGFLRDTRWAASGPLGYALVPVQAAFATARLQEASFRDPRLLIGSLAVVVAAIAGLGRLAPRSASRTATFDLVAYWTAGYAAWVVVFSYYRYALVLELLAPVVALAVVACAWPRARVAVALAVAAVALAGTSIGAWPRVRGWSPPWFDAEVPGLATTRGALVFLPEPKSSFAVPFFPGDATFVGLFQIRHYGPALTQQIDARVRNHRGPFLVLARAPERARPALDRFDLDLGGECETLRLTRGRATVFNVCPLTRVEPGSGPGAAVEPETTPVRRRRRGRSGKR